MIKELMKNRLGILILGCSAMCWTGCEDVIEIDPQFSDSQIVVDAWITDESKDQVITLKESQQYFDNTDLAPISGASVIVTRNDGQELNFQEREAGVYVWTPDADEKLGSEGDQFALEIIFNGTTLTAASTLNRVPPIDSITQELEENDAFLEDGIYLEFISRDPEGLGDSYWIKSFKNGSFLADADQMNIAFDAGFDAGSQVDGIIFIPPIRTFINEFDNDGVGLPWNVGDEARVEIHSLNLEAFNFLEIARDQILNGDNGIFALPLANTRTNISSSDQSGLSPLGMFNVSAVSSMDYTVQ